MSPILKNTVAIVNYTLQTLEGELIDEGNTLAYIHGYNNLLNGMEKSLEGKIKGDNIHKILDPKDTFGDYIEESKPIRIHRNQFGKEFSNLENGIEIPVKDQQGNNTVLYVQSIENDHVVLTQNHPLAGIQLILNANVIDVRNALPEEISSRMAFGIEGDQIPSSCSCC